MKKLGLKVAFVLAGAVVGSAALGQNKVLDLTVIPVLQGTPGISQSVLKTLIRNEGAATTATLAFDRPGYHISYPVALAERSTTTKIICVPTGDAESSLSIQAGPNSTSLTIGRRYEDYISGRLLEIGGKSTDFSVDNQSNTRQHVSRISAEDAPDSQMAYVGWPCVYLATGAEELSAGALNALEEYVLGGGAIVIGGDASSPYKLDPRLARLISVQLGGTRTVESSPILDSVTPTPNGSSDHVHGFRSIGLIAGQGVETFGDQEDRPLVARTRLGRGQVVLLGFDLTSSSFATWTGKEKFLTSVRRDTGGSNGSIYVSNPLPRSAVDTAVRQPFRIAMPTSWRIFSILGIYFIIVVPLNFAVLQRLKRRQFAWVTAPVLSLGFAFVLLSQASALYALPTSSSSSMQIIAQQELPNAIVKGQSTFFIKDAGNYQIALKHVEQAGLTYRAMGTSYGPENDQVLDTPVQLIEDGGIQVKPLKATNLTLYKMTLLGRLDSNFVHLVRNGDVVTVSASTPIDHAVLCTRDGIYRVGSLSAGSSVRVSKSWLLSGYFKEPRHAIAPGETPDSPNAFAKFGQIRSNEAYPEFDGAANSVVGDVSQDLGRAVLIALPAVFNNEMVLVGEAPKIEVGAFVGRNDGPATTFIFSARDPR